MTEEEKTISFILGNEILYVIFPQIPPETKQESLTLIQCRSINAQHPSVVELLNIVVINRPLGSQNFANINLKNFNEVKLYTLIFIFINLYAV